jgi:hypothetical protein
MNAVMDGCIQIPKTSNQGGIYHGNGSKEQHVGSSHSEHVEHQSEQLDEEPREGLFGHED